MSSPIFKKVISTSIMGSGAGLSTQGVMRPNANFYNANRAVIFSLPLNDLGAGIVNTVPAIAAGSPTATFTRATVAWTKLSTGLWAQVASGQPRSGYTGMNTAIGTYGGFFTEGAGTQLVTPDASIRDMTDASWVAVNVTPAKTATGIDGVVNSATTLTSGAIGGTIQQTLTAAASSRTYSCWIRRVSGTGTITINQGATTSDITAQINASTYTQVSLTASVLNAAFGITFGASGDVIEVDFNQFEATAFATSPMTTAGAARNADILTYANTGNVLAAVGTAYCEVQSMPGSTAVAQGYIVSGNSGRQLIEATATATDVRIFDGTTSLDKNGLNNVTTAIRKRASCWGGSTMSVTGDGLAPATGAFDGAMALDAALEIGNFSAGGTHLRGWIKNIQIRNVQLSDAQLQALTT